MATHFLFLILLFIVSAVISFTVTLQHRRRRERELRRTGVLVLQDAVLRTFFDLKQQSSRN